MNKRYREILHYYESCLKKYGDNHRGVAWPKSEDVDIRHNIMLGIIDSRSTKPVNLLDFGCGASHLYEYILRQGYEHIRYSGLDISPNAISLSKRKFPDVPYYHMDILDDTDTLPNFDYIVMNGVFTVKVAFSFQEMFSYLQDTITSAFQKAEYGIAFNVMSKQVNWEREDLFHVPLDTMADFLEQRLSRHFVIRHDYGLWEYTVYVYRDKHRPGCVG